jgi:hypothetical protein
MINLAFGARRLDAMQVRDEGALLLTGGERAATLPS